jgi:ribonuclease HI
MVTIFTDGASRGNPGPGGWGTVIVFGTDKSVGRGDRVVELGGREDTTTNNRMEIAAAVNALENLPVGSSAAVHTDSSYLINGITKWVKGWQANGWMTKAKEEVLNQDLWERLVEAIDGKQISWKYVGGHSGIAGNERCDEIATAFADETYPRLYDGPLSGYKIKNILDLSHTAEKVSKKSHSKAKAYSYVSLVDGKLMVHQSWVECEARVKGKKGVHFKKALSAEDERAISAEFLGK